MAAATSSSPSPSSPLSPPHSPHQAQNLRTGASTSPLPPLNTSTSRRTPLVRPTSFAKSRMSTYSTASRLSERGSRPISQAFPLFHSSLSYALVRDFAYPMAHPSHYGPPPPSSEPASGTSTPVSERHRRLSDPPNGAWDNAAPWGGEGYFAGQQLPQLAYGDGPPYSEDEDLHSPVVKSSRHKKPKPGYPHGDLYGHHDGRRGYLPDVGEERMADYYRGSERGIAGDGRIKHGRDGNARIPGERLVPSGSSSRGDRSKVEDSEEESLGVPDHDDSRYSRDYQFTIASPDEEMHGKAVALFDFERENENELPLTEGQIIWVSYRHGQGWLVAEDPKTGDAGLVPEEYVRLLRDIQGGLGSLSGEEDQAEPESEQSSPEGETDTSPVKSGHVRSNSNSQGEKNAAVVSSFSTSSKDLDPFPQHLLGEKASQAPPQVVHYSSQTNTPTLRSNFETLKGPASSEGAASKPAKSKDSR